MYIPILSQIHPPQTSQNDHRDHMGSLCTRTPPRPREVIKQKFNIVLAMLTLCPFVGSSGVTDHR